MFFADQFEELFTQTDDTGKQRFGELVDVLLQRPNTFLLLTLRSEFMHRLAAWLGSEAFQASLLMLDPIKDDQRLSEIIARPARDSNPPLRVQPDLVAELVSAARVLAGALPLLALALERLFRAADPENGLTLAAYREMGELQGVVETAIVDVDRAIDEGPALALACERLFADLATVIDEVPTRRTAAAAALRDDAQVGELLDHLRSLGFVADPDDQHVELAHETLLGHWPRLRAWCDRYGDKLALRRQAEVAAGEWQKASAREAAAIAQPGDRRVSDLLRWTWERQKPALEALLALSPHLAAARDADFNDGGIDAWRALSGQLAEPLQAFLHPESLRLLDELRRDSTPHQRREEIGLRLDQMGDVRAGVALTADGLPDIAWIDIPAGQVTLETYPPETLAVGAFRIARYPITWRQYRVFLDADDGYRDPRWWDGLQQKELPGDVRWAFGNYPAINVSWYDAMAFCRWLNHRSGLTASEVIRLPMESEWQWVAQSGSDRREYPWPGGWRPDRANSEESGIGRTTAVGLYPLGAPDRWPVMDLAGNVW